jgi:hypothetical protein
MFQLFSHHQVYYFHHAIKLIDTAKHTILTKYMVKVLKVKGTMIKWWIRKSNKIHNLKVKILQLYRWRYIGTWSCRVYISIEVLSRMEAIWGNINSFMMPLSHDQLYSFILNISLVSHLQAMTLTKDTPVLTSERAPHQKKKTRPYLSKQY